MIAAHRSRCAALAALLVTAATAARAEAPAAAAPGGAPAAPSAPDTGTPGGPSTPAPDLRLQVDPGVLPPGAPVMGMGSPKAMPPAPLYGLLPALEVIGFNVLMNRIAYLSNPEVYGVSLESWKDNLNGPWWYDEDQFRTNQFAHPYQGNVYFNSARSLGRGFWESWGYAIGGSFMWEFFGETEPPSVNDAITTPFAGGILGEVLFRLSNRILDDGGPTPGFWHEVAAAVLSPAAGFNRALYGNRYRPEDLNQEPLASEVRAALGVGARGEDGTSDLEQDVPLALSVRLVNGVPGSSFRLRKPLDHFDATFGLTIDRKATSSEAFGTILLRGLLLGRQYGEAPSSGLWGLFANYDYVAPTIFRAGSCNLGLGTTGQVAWDGVALQGHALLGLGFGSGGSSSTVAGYRDYHFGAQAVLQLEATLFLWDRLRLRWNNREYFTSGKASPEPGSWEDITYGTLALSGRLAGSHALGLEIVAARRSAHYPDVPDVHAGLGSALLYYEYHSDPWMGRGH